MHSIFLVTECVNGVWMNTHWFNGPTGRDQAKAFIAACKNPYTTTVVSMPEELFDKVSVSIATPDNLV